MPMPVASNATDNSSSPSSNELVDMEAIAPPAVPPAYRGTSS
jgi:hypothetical protein